MNAKVREIQTMQEILTEIDSDTLVVFDIDNTLFEPVTAVGSDQYFYFLRQYFEDKYQISREEASKKAENVWNNSQSLITTRPVEASTPELIRSLQANKVKVFALTARIFGIADITKHQLLHNGMDFTQEAVCKERSFRIDDNAVYSQGILYQGEGNDKGKTLVKFLEMLNLKPKKIVFVDDKEHNTFNVFNALEALGIEHVEYRYGATDKSVKDFMAQVASPEFRSKAEFSPWEFLELFHP